MSIESKKISVPACSICFQEELSSSQIVYSSCCFQKVCNICDQRLNQCPHCRAELGELRIRFGAIQYDMKNSSILRLLPQHNTVDSVISVVKKYFPLTETKLTQPLSMKFHHSNGSWSHYPNGQIRNHHEYYLEQMRLPHKELTDPEVEGWILALLVSGDALTKEPLTKEEIHRKCKLYADKIFSVSLSQKYVNSRIQRLVEKCYCCLDEKTGVYHYLS